MIHYKFDAINICIFVNRIKQLMYVHNSASKTVLYE